MKVILDSIQALILRDLAKLKHEIESYSTEEDVWTTKGEIKNSAGNLCLHLCGNLQHYIGMRLGNSNYIRNRDAEFSTKGLPIKNLSQEVEITIQRVSETFQKLEPEVLDTIYSEEVFGRPMTTFFFLIHLVGHLNYHLGQINYHRRLISEA